MIMTGDIYIKGNLYTNDLLEGKYLKENGIVIHVHEDFIYGSDVNDINLKPNDVYIEDIFEKFDIKNIIAFNN